MLQVHEVFEDNDNYTIIMELCAGGELFKKILEKDHFTEKQAACIMTQLLKFLHFAHERVRER